MTERNSKIITHPKMFTARLEAVNQQALEIARDTVAGLIEEDLRDNVKLKGDDK